MSFSRLAQSQDNHPFSELQPTILAQYENAMGKTIQYFAIDNQQFPPRGMATFEYGDSLIAATVGMSLCPQPMVEMAVEDPTNFRRIELAIRLPVNADPESIQQVLQQVSGLAGMPWQRFTWLGPKHTCGMHSLAKIFGEAYQNVRLERNGLQSGDLPSLELPDFRDDPVHVLWLEPLEGNIA